MAAAKTKRDAIRQAAAGVRRRWTRRERVRRASTADEMQLRLAMAFGLVPVAAESPAKRRR